MFEGFAAYNFGMKSTRCISGIRYRNIENFVEEVEEIYKNTFPPRGYWILTTSLLSPQGTLRV